MQIDYSPQARHETSKARNHHKEQASQTNVEAEIGGRSGILESPPRGRKRKEALPLSTDGLQTRSRQSERASPPSRSPRGHQRRELLLPQADEREDADGHRHDRWRGDSRMHRVVRQSLPQAESRRGAEPAD